ncbi:MAG: MATE family efflux transporter [Oscillospiraceae bacterium]|nr:MATE family efflux transporter [Oscillospiraceae bacterium]
MLAKFKSLFGAQDMTVGKPLKCLLLFSIPLLIGNVAQLLYSTVDSIVVGRYIGDAALSAIGVTSPILNLFLVLFIAIGSGVMVMVSQYFGAREYDNLKNSIGNSITLIAAVSVVLTALGLTCARWMLRVTAVPPESFEMSYSYLFICFAGVAGNGFYNIMSGVLRGMGESVFPLLVLLGTTVLNIILDILFVAGLHMGIAGAALATVIGQSLSAVVCLLKVVLSRTHFTLTWKSLKLRREVVGTICRLGIPNGLAQAIMWFSTIVVQRLNNTMGYMVTASITAMMRVDSFALIPGTTFNMSSSTFTGQNVGAGRMDRVKKGCYTTFGMCLVVSGVMVTLMLLFGKWMIGMFTTTQEVIELGYSFILIMIPAYFIMAIGQSFGGVIRGAGDAMGPMWISLITQTVVRIPTAYLIAHFTRSEAYPHGDPHSTFYALLFAIIINASATLLYFRYGPWKTKGLTAKAKQAQQAEA